MSINNCHTVDKLGVILFYGERLLVNYKGCELKLSGKNGQPSCNCSGIAFLTSHRVLFLPKSANNGVISLSMPFIYMKGVEIKQPTFGANRLEGFVLSENNIWQGKLPFSMTFKHGGAIEFGKSLLELGSRANKEKANFKSPASAPAMSDYYACPPPAYAPPYSDPYYNFMPQHEAFSPPMPNVLYQTATLPPYPGATPPPYSASAPAVPATGYAPPIPQNGAAAYPSGLPNCSLPSNDSTPYPGYAPPPGIGAYPTYGMPPSASGPYPPTYGPPGGSPYQQSNTQNSAVNEGYYFPQDPHTLYAPIPSAPPATIDDKKNI